MNYQTTTNAPDYRSFPINTGINGKYYCFDIMLQKLLDGMRAMTQKHNKVLFIRFDLRFPQDYSIDVSNDKASHLFKILTERFDYRGIELLFGWVREQSREKHQHYHCILLLDGNKVQNYFPILEEVSRIWGYVLQCDPAGLVDYCNHDRNGTPVKNGIMIRRPSSKAVGEELARQQQKYNEDFARCFEWASYLAKVHQKANTPRGSRRFGFSQRGKTIGRSSSSVH